MLRISVAWLRAAHNHVRTMLRGRKSYGVYHRRRFESFFFPQRLWMAFALSLWYMRRERSPNPARLSHLLSSTRVRVAWAAGSNC